MMESCITDVPRVRKEDLELHPEAEVAQMANIAGALSDPIRLQMLFLLSQVENLCTCEFEELLDLSQSRVSYHMNELLQAGIVIRENRGTWSHYRLRRPQILEQVKNWIRTDEINVTPA